MECRGTLLFVCLPQDGILIKCVFCRIANELHLIDHQDDLLADFEGPKLRPLSLPCRVQPATCFRNQRRAYTIFNCGNLIAFCYLKQRMQRNGWCFIGSFYGKKVKSIVSSRGKTVPHQCLSWAFLNAVWN